MRTELRFRATTSGLLLLAAGIVAAGLFLNGRGAIGQTDIDTLPGDLDKLGLEITSASASGAISRDDAMKAAIAFEGELPAGSTSEAYLVTASDPRLSEMSDRRVWIIRVVGFVRYFPGPVSASGSAAPGHTARHLYILIDAETGEAISSQYSG